MKDLGEALYRGRVKFYHLDRGKQGQAYNDTDLVATSSIEHRGLSGLVLPTGLESTQMTLHFTLTTYISESNVIFGKIS